MRTENVFHFYLDIIHMRLLYMYTHAGFPVRCLTMENKLMLHDPYRHIISFFFFFIMQMQTDRFFLHSLSSSFE